MVILVPVLLDCPGRGCGVFLKEYKCPGGGNLLKPRISLFSIVLTTVVMVFSASSTVADAVIYRWIDERGSPVNSDRPPPKGVDYEVVSTSSRMVRSVASEEGAVPLEVEPSASNDFQLVDSRAPVIEKNPEYCQRARDNLQALATSASIRIRNEEGEYRYINEEEKLSQRKRAEESITAYCEN